MPLIEWEDNLSVGVQEIDAQHKVMIGILNELNDSMMLGQPRDKTKSLLHRLVSHAREHFAAEEAMMGETGYLRLEEHREQHRELIRKILIYVGRFERGEATLNLYLMDFLRDWLKIHILEEDKAYGLSTKERGFGPASERHHTPRINLQLARAANS